MKSEGSESKVQTFYPIVVRVDRPNSTPNLLYCVIFTSPESDLQSGPERLCSGRWKEKE